MNKQLEKIFTGENIIPFSVTLSVRYTDNSRRSIQITGKEEIQRKMVNEYSERRSENITEKASKEIAEVAKVFIDYYLKGEAEKNES